MNVPKLRFKEFTDKWLLLKENIKILSGNMYPLSAYNDTGVLLIQGLNIYPKKLNLDKPIYISNEFNAVKHLIIQKNDILIGLNRPIINNELKICKFMYDYAYLYQRAGVLSFNKKKINTDCLYQYLQSHQFIKNLSTELVGSDQPYIKSNLFNIVKIYFPKLEEQNKIAKFLTTVDKKITNLENTITSLENQKKGLLQQIFSQKLRFKDKNGNNYPNWEKKKLGDIATLKNGISKSNEAFGHGKKFINLQDIFNKSYIFNGNYSLVDVTEKELSENNLLKGDVLFVRSSVKREGVGLPCVIMENLIDTVYSGFIIRCRFNINENIYLHYKKYCFLEFSFRKALLKKSSSSANTNINQDNLSKLYVKLPCLEEQTKIADFLSAFDRKLDNQKAQLEHWQQIKKGLLQQMFV